MLGGTSGASWTRTTFSLPSSLPPAAVLGHGRHGFFIPVLEYRLRPTELPNMQRGHTEYLVFKYAIGYMYVQSAAYLLHITSLHVSASEAGPQLIYCWSLMNLLIYVALYVEPNQAPYIILTRPSNISPTH